MVISKPEQAWIKLGLSTEELPAVAATGNGLWTMLEGKTSPSVNESGFAKSKHPCRHKQVCVVASAGVFFKLVI